MAQVVHLEGGLQAILGEPLGGMVRSAAVLDGVHSFSPQASNASSDHEKTFQHFLGCPNNAVPAFLQCGSESSVI